VDLDLRQPGGPSLGPKIDFPSEYPIIASRPSEMHRIVAGINEVVEKLKEIDPKGISDQLIATAKALEELIKGKQIASLLTRLDGAAGNLERLTARADQALDGHSLEKILADARETLSGARTLVTTVTDQVMAMKLPATLGNARDIARDLQATTNTLRQSSETLEMLLQRLYERPSDLLFGKPPKKRWNE
jgi:phospholipid/cholesterol/gamma-HCH transport system substrate-binding protein